MSYTPQQIAGALDYALLSPTATEENIRKGANFCVYHGIKCFCVSSANVLTASQFHGNVASVIGFPHGNVHPAAKEEEALCAINAGARELDVVINYGRFRGGDEGIVLNELRPICNAAHRCDVIVKAILETQELSPQQIDRASQLCIEAEVDYLKTSTCSPGATPEAVEIMLDVACGTGVKVKASGGIKCYADAVKFLDMGCKRLGTSRYLELLPCKTD